MGKQNCELVAVGVTFQNRQSILKELYMDWINDTVKYIDVKLEKEDNNPYDKNAIAIKLLDGSHIGYISKEINQEIRAIFDNIEKVYITNIYMNKKRIFNFSIRIEYVD